jgi:hypothetical protein
MTEKLLNADYELNPTTFSGAKAQILTGRQHSQNSFFVIIGAEDA